MRIYYVRQMLNPASGNGKDTDNELGGKIKVFSILQ